MAALEEVLKTSFIIFCLLEISLSIENDTNVRLLCTTTDAVVLLDTETGVTTNISDGNGYYVDYHYRTGYIYWSDLSTNTISRKKYPFDGSDDEVIVANDSYPFGIAIDMESDHLYWSDYNNMKLLRSDLDGSNRTEILTGLYYPMAITLDTINKWIYYSQESDGSIGKCKFDGSHHQSIITDNIMYPYGISLDLIEQRIYWTGYYPSCIKSAKLDGSDVQLITSEVLYPIGIEVHNNDIYFIEDYSKLYKQSKFPGSSKILIHTDTSYIWDVKVYQKDTHECRSYTERKNEVRRSSGYKMDLTVDTALSDDSLEENWYRFVSDNGDEMCTYPPGVLSCGAYHPIWLNGSLPSRNDGNVAMTTCMQTENNTCEMTFNINITNCGGYYVYYMVQTPTNSSYCVGKGSVKCPDGLSSESGYYPGCTSSFPNSMVSPTVESVLIDGPAYNISKFESTPSLLPVFKCNFDDFPNVTYVYDVYWYINGNNVTSYRNISYSNISTTVFKGSDWTHSYNMNMEVQCSVRLRYSVGSVPGPFMQSQVFAAGLYPDNYEYTVIEGEFVNVGFTSTVPIGCVSSHSSFMPHCSQNIYVFQPKHDDTPSSCVNNIASKDVVFKAEFCGIKLTTLDWNETKYLKVYGFSDGIYNQQDRSTYIQLSTTTVTTLNDIWKDIQIPDIKITVIDKDSTLTNRLCQSYNDPHITTFDGKPYHYMEIGEFVMYRNDKGPFWVHSLFTNCGFGWQGSACHCGIAIRSRSSLFVLRTCETISRNDKHLLQQPVTELKTCDDSDMLIEQDGNGYKVTLPIGTEIRFRISTWSKFITMISIKPSIYDINEAKGLCGFPSTNKDTSDDFTHRQFGPINDDKTFADSWRITSVMTSEQLFIAEPEFLNNQQVIEIDDTVDSGDNITSYCVCERQAGSSDDLDDFNTVQCNLTESTQYCSGSSQSTEESSGTIYTSCSGSNRKKRSVSSSHTTESSSSSDSDDVLEFKPLIYDDDVNNTDGVVPNTFRNGWNESNAYQKCLESIRKALPTDLYTDVVDLQEESFIQSCVKDIELVGGVTFLPDTIGTMVTFIITEIRRNESLYTMKTSNGSETVLEYISSFLCPNNCSDNGNCTSGVCSCYDGYTDDDCSKEISTPPSGISLPSNGLCTLGTRKCKRTNVYGDFPSTSVWYQLKYFQILKDTQEFASDVEILEAKYRNMFMVSVELPSSRRKRDTSDTALAYGYEISLSNDRQSFGDSVHIIIYDESCYTCNSTSVTCTVLESCPESSTKVVNDNWKVIAVGVSLCVVVAFLLVIGLICFRKKDSKKEIKVVGENKEDTTSTDHEMTFSNIGMTNENTFSNW